MNKKIITIIILIMLIGILAINIGSLPQEKIITSSINYTITPDDVLKNYSVADWSSNAKTVSEVSLESDIIVRARVIESPITYVVDIEAPVMDENGTPTHSTIIKVLVSYTTFEVLETYMGKSSKTINISQTGGFDPSISKGVEEMIDDPLYKIGEEYILFLRNVSDNSVDESISELYRIVNPFGRYLIENNIVASYGEMYRIETDTMVMNINELEIQIDEAVKLLSSLTEQPVETSMPVEETNPTLTEIITPTP